MASLDNLLKYAGYVIIFALVTPWLFIGSYGIKIDYIVILLSCPFLFLWSKEKFAQAEFVRTVFYSCICIFLVMLISNTMGYVSFRNSYSIYFPTEWTQILNRGFCAILFYYLGSLKILKKESFMKVLSYTFIISLLFGALQIIRLSALDSFFSLYATTDSQFRSLSNTSSLRIFGSVGNSISWGGLCIFMFYFFYLLRARGLLKVAGIALSLAGVLFSGSKSAIISLGVSLVFCTIYKSLKGDFKIARLVLGLISIAVLLITVNYIFMQYFPSQYEFMLFRFSKIDEGLAADSYDGRGYQLVMLQSLLQTDPLNLVFGVGKPLLYEIVGYVEIEFFYLLGCYGLIGVSIHYYLLFYVCKTAVRGRLSHNQKTFVLVTTFAYLIFSLGFYFFRELGAGLYYWIVAGYLIGSSKSLSFKPKSNE